MTRQAYFPVRVADQIIWLTNFYLKLLGHAASLGVTVVRCDAAVADARWLIYILGSWLPAVRAWQKSCTEAAEAAQNNYYLYLLGCSSQSLIQKNYCVKRQRLTRQIHHRSSCYYFQ